MTQPQIAEVPVPRQVGRHLALFVALSASLAPVGAAAWGSEGHQVVALVADGMLKRETRSRIAAILALEPGATLASVSSWADRSRDRSTDAWHYINLPRDANCEQVQPRDCPAGNCVVGALATQLDRLATASGVEQIEALKYVVHFVADIHQPLHAGFSDDRGGNGYQLQAFGAGTNLHALWDGALLREINLSASAMAKTLLARTRPAGASRWAPEEWAAESCRIVSRAGFYPPGHAVGDEYLQTFAPVVMDRLHLAGLRLAATLNHTLRSRGSALR